METTTAIIIFTIFGILLIGIIIWGVILCNMSLYLRVFEKDQYAIYKYVMSHISDCKFDYYTKDGDVFKLYDLDLLLTCENGNYVGSIFKCNGDNVKCLFCTLYTKEAKALGEELLKIKTKEFEPSICKVEHNKLYYLQSADDINNGYWIFLSDMSDEDLSSLAYCKKCIYFSMRKGEILYSSVEGGKIMNDYKVLKLRLATAYEEKMFSEFFNI
jgi:hypothetical protein